MIATILLLAQMLGVGASTNVTIVSDTKTENAWERKVVMKTEDGRIINDENQVGSSADAAADLEAARHAGEISEAARVAMTGQIARLDAAQESAATNAIGLALVIAPELSYTNLTGFVVKETTANGIDRQWVYYNNELAMKPNRYVVYRGIDNCSTVKVEWVQWSASGETVTVNGRTWSGCHQCTVQRPSWAIGETCLTNPNESRWGGPNGMEFGDMTLTMGDYTLVTAILTNRLNSSEVIYFDNGFFKGFITE